MDWVLVGRSKKVLAPKIEDYTGNTSHAGIAQITFKNIFELVTGWGSLRNIRRFVKRENLSTGVAAELRLSESICKSSKTFSAGPT